MMGGGAPGGKGDKKKRNRAGSLGLMADSLEDEESIEALGRGASAGSRDAIPIEGSGAEDQIW